MPKYTVVIPTRNRAGYLAASLASVLKAGRADVQVVVSDNSDPDQTEAVRAVLASASGAVEYVRPPDAPVAMSPNWEFALRQARGEYVTVIGDDDALLPSALAVLDRVIAATAAPAVRWPYAFYFWPDHATPGLRDTLRVPVTPPARRYRYEWVDGGRTLRDVARFRAPYLDLPMLYNSAVRKDVLDRLLAGPGPRLRAISPDVYSGMAVTHLAGRHVTLATPLGVSGHGAKANGTAHLVAASNREVVTDFERLNRASGVRYLESLPRTPTITYAVADCVVRLHEAYPETATRAPLDVRRMVLDTARQLNAWVTDPAEHAAHFDRLARHYPELAPRLGRVRRQWCGCGAVPHAPPEFGLDAWSMLTVRPSRVGVTDVAGAAELADLLVGHDPARFGLPPARRSLREMTRDLLPPALWRLGSRVKQSLAR